ncbi:hypothetical protein TSAR_000861 [Trichomalopsis sarcophagae]|uniref:Uncharacterized protein n=1 Tax=Trichomalopsis sarcophagae TaxID=543379 RepID=A0A232ESL9_9HYME|nr:hypothetical protein TSAR_000861 [Trichomalopsis sarcophagae]
MKHYLRLKSSTKKTDDHTTDDLSIQNNNITIAGNNVAAHGQDELITGGHDIESITNDNDDENHNLNEVDSNNEQSPDNNFVGRSNNNHAIENIVDRSRQDNARPILHPNNVNNLDSNNEQSPDNNFVGRSNNNHAIENVVDRRRQDNPRPILHPNNVNNRNDNQDRNQQNRLNNQNNYMTRGDTTKLIIACCEFYIGENTRGHEDYRKRYQVTENMIYLGEGIRVPSMTYYFIFKKPPKWFLRWLAIEI